MEERGIILCVIGLLLLFLWQAMYRAYKQQKQQKQPIIRMQEP